MTTVTTNPPRLGAGLTPGKAQQWIVVSAITVGGMYFLRRLVEGTGVGASNTSRGRIQALLGMGSPVSLAEFLVSYGVTYFVLAVMAMGAPELAASFAILVMVVNAINNGQAVSTDLAVIKTPQPPAGIGHIQITQGTGAGTRVLAVQPAGNGQLQVRAPGA